MRIINNQNTLLIDELRDVITDTSEIRISCGFFTSFAFFELIKSFKKAASVQFLLNYKSDYAESFNYLQSDAEKRLNFDLDRRYKVKQVLELVGTEVEFRHGNLGNQNILLVSDNGTTKTFVITPMNLDSVALGTASTEEAIFIHNYEDAGNQYLELFENAWNNSKLNINAKMLEVLEKGVQGYSPEAIYKYCMREIFHYSTISERADEKLQKVGFKDSKVWGLLYNFQKDAVIGAIEKIETYGGCIIADSVGLGKTFEALAVMKYYQLRNDRILVLAPKKLRENWTIYQLNDKRNILAQDRLNYDVLNHTDLSRDKGKSGDIDLEMINWGNYDLVVIDESHNFRNNPNRRDGITRYSRLMNDVIKSNIRTKVLMLSATPVNNRMNDLKNQVAFITEGDDHAFRANRIESVTQVMKDAQRRFTQWYRNNDPDNLNVNQLMESLDGSYFRILDMLTIARSRKHIEKYYDTAELGQFPERLQPITVQAEIDTNEQFKDIGQLYDEISTLSLAAYTPLGYVRADKQEFYEEKYDMKTHTGSVFKQVDREQSLIYLMRVNLLKRLESSIHSFRETVVKLIEFINENLNQIELHKNGEIDLDLNITDIDLDDTDLEDMLVGGKTKVLVQDVDLIRWKQDLKHDKSILTSLANNIKLIDVSRDAKLLRLKKIIENKANSPINGENQKIIIFTAYTDTANYLYKELKAWVKEEHDLYSALVTGSGDNKTNMPGCKPDLNSVLTNFSPVSKRRDEIAPWETKEIDILFCTDCISEGQNLQDCDFLVNYDIHWNPTRIVQRFGRIDRIGSKNERIQLVNFFPSMELDSFIDLVARVQGRMVMLDVSATGEDNIISKNSREMQDLDYRKRQLRQLQDQVIDLEDVQGNISITDLTFNDFKIDLEKSSDEQIQELNEIPPSSYAVVSSNLESIKPGVLFCLKDSNAEHENKLRNNILYPFFLVYISEDGDELVSASQTKVALDYFRKLSMGNDKVLADLLKEFDKETQNNKRMQKYTALLEQAVKEVVGVQEEIGLDALATPGAAAEVVKSVGERTEIELVATLFIK